jgi:hypothetical protein
MTSKRPEAMSTGEFIDAVLFAGAVARREAEGSIVIEEEHTAARAARVRPRRQRRGRPGWTRAQFIDRWAEAWRDTRQPRTWSALAAHFRALDGTLGGMTGDSLRHLHRRAERGDLD